MTNPHRNIAIVAVVAVLLVFGIAIPRYWRQDNPNIDPTIRNELHTEAEMSFDAPLLELLGGTVIRLDSYNPATKITIAGAYAWFGVKVATITLNECQYWTRLNEKSFYCNGGSTVSYALWL